MAKKVKSGTLFLLLAALFLGMFAVFGPGVYNDSDQYIRMHIHREPLYPLFLAALRAVFGEHWLTAMGILQNLLAAGSIWLFAEYLSGKFSLYLWEEVLVVLVQLMPHLITKYCSSLHLFITNSVMSEALCLPLFTIFLMECFRMFAGTKKGSCIRDGVLSLLTAFLLSLTRSQMMITILIWAVVLGARLLRKRKAGSMWYRTAGKLLLVVTVTALVFVLRLFAVKSYNLVYNGHFINNTYGTVNTLTNILYAADREDGEAIEDEEAKAFFYRMYDLTEERQANYKYAGSTPKEKIEHIEEWHDSIKFEMIEDVFYQTYDKTVTSDYITQNLMADEAAGKIIAGIFPKCFGRWLAGYFLIAWYGLIRSIAVVHPVINWLAFLLYLGAAGMAVLMIVKNRREKEKIDDGVWFMGLALLAVCANVFAVAFTIMALSRYMIYGFAIFYTACFVLGITWFRRINAGRAEKGMKSWDIKI